MPTEQEEIILRNQIAAFEKTFANINKAFDPVTIDVSFQVIADGNVGDMPQQFIVDQINVLNTAYASHGFQFNLLETIRTNNVKLYSKCVDDKRDESFKAKRRDPNDGPEVLYIYTCIFLLNYWDMPHFRLMRQKHRSLMELSSTVKLYPEDLMTATTLATLPFMRLGIGKSLARFGIENPNSNSKNHIRLGLLHTFQGGCTGGDYVDDTPAVAEPNFDCVVIDSCPTDPGNDAVNNYMDYSGDVRMTEFTDGQALRMQALWNIYRSGDASVNPPIMLENGIPLSGQSLTEGTWQTYLFPKELTDLPFPVTASVTLNGDNGDADLFVYLCGSTNPGSVEESCIGDISDEIALIEVYASSTFTGWTITATLSLPQIKKLDNMDKILTGLSLGPGEEEWYKLEKVSGGTSFSISIIGDNGDADLRVYFGATLQCYGSNIGSSSEFCDVKTQTTTNVYILLIGSEASTDLTLTIDFSGGEIPSSSCNIFLAILDVILKIFTLGLVKLCG